MSEPINIIPDDQRDEFRNDMGEVALLMAPLLMMLLFGLFMLAIA